MRAVRSASSDGQARANNRIKAAAGTSTTRDQCDRTLCGEPIRCAKRANQACPASRSRNCVILVTSLIFANAPVRHTSAALDPDRTRATA